MAQKEYPGRVDRSEMNTTSMTAEQGTRRGSKALGALVVFLLMCSPMAGAIAAAVTDGWAVPIWLGGWMLAIMIPLTLAVMRP